MPPQAPPRLILACRSRLRWQRRGSAASSQRSRAPDWRPRGGTRNPPHTGSRPSAGSCCPPPRTAGLRRLPPPRSGSPRAVLRAGERLGGSASALICRGRAACLERHDAG
ncbi:MAG: hypothetical protein ACK56I_23170 [bacterium]